MPVTPNLQRIDQEITQRWSRLRYSIVNCRHISSNPMRPWSQHAASEPAFNYRSNALDIFAATVTLDQIAAYLNAHRSRLSIRQTLWRVRSHFDHIHVDCWPKMYDRFWYTPPCKGGKLITVNKDGSRGTTFGNVVPPPLPPTLEALHMAYADTLDLDEWVSTLRADDIDQLFDLGVHSGDAGHWKTLLARHPNQDDSDSWENFRRTTSARIGFWQPEGAGTIVQDASSYKLIGDITPT